MAAVRGGGGGGGGGDSGQAGLLPDSGCGQERHTTYNQESVQETRRQVSPRQEQGSRRGGQVQGNQ